MPFVLRHKESSRIYTCTLVNSYKLAYYGTKYWDYEEDAAAEVDSFLRAQFVNESEIEKWSIMEISEHQLKMCNVKLKNDPRLTLYWDESNGTLHVRASSSGS